MSTVLDSRSTASSKIKNQQILLIEDDEADVQLLQTVLNQSKSPYQLQTIARGEDVISLVNAQKVEADLILLDITLPAMDGFKTLAQLRAMPAMVSTPIFMLTASDEMRDIIEAQELGASGYIVKPMRFSLDELLSAVECVNNIPGVFIKVGQHA